MNKYAAIASLLAASAFVSHANAEAYRYADRAPAAALKAAKKTARK